MPKVTSSFELTLKSRPRPSDPDQLGAKPATVYLLQRTNTLDGEWVCCRRILAIFFSGVTYRVPNLPQYEWSTQ
jgi:hypothetical protein